MNERELLQATERASFADLNGQILRMCNMLKPSVRTLNAVYTLCKHNENYDYTAHQIDQSMEYLCESGYLEIEHPKGIACLSEYESGMFGKVALKITAKGMQLLMGVIEDTCVEI